MDTQHALFEYILRLADDQLILGHQLSMWCGHAPILEEDIALANIALDCLGQANYLLELAAQIENKNRTADDLAYFRDILDFRNTHLVEAPNGDFAMTIVRQFLYDAHAYEVYRHLAEGDHPELAAIAARSLKETRYHLRHSRHWMLRLGDGTDESKRRTQHALDILWAYTDELFDVDAIHAHLVEHNIAPDLAPLRETWLNLVTQVITEATLTVPTTPPIRFGTRKGFHSEHLGLVLAEMQSVARSFPGAQW